MKKIKCDCCGREVDLETNVDWVYEYDNQTYCDICSDDLIDDLLENGDLDVSGSTTYYEHNGNQLGSSDDITELLGNLIDFGYDYVKLIKPKE